MSISTLPSTLTARGFQLDRSSSAFGELRRCDVQQADWQQLSERLQQDGYLYLPGFFARDAVERVRHALCARMEAEGMLDPDHPVIDAVAPLSRRGLTPQMGSSKAFDRLAQCPELAELIYGPRVMDFFGQLFAAQPRHYEYTWLRAVPPGLGTVPHCDLVYMGRGTQRVYTMWTPYDDISLEMGGLMVLEGSTSADVQARLANYIRRDVDEYCSNRPVPEHIDFSTTDDNKVWNGWLARNPVTLRRNLGGRWLTTEYAMGDVMIFSMTLVHGSLDNHTDRYRLSSDSRYQRADEPIDDRFVGPGPYGHIGRAKRGRVC